MVVRRPAITATPGPPPSLCLPHSRPGLPAAEGVHGRLEANLKTMAFLRGKPCPELFEFLQKEEGIRVSSSYLISLCSVGYLSPDLPAVSMASQGPRHPHSPVSKSQQCQGRRREVRFRRPSSSFVAHLLWRLFARVTLGLTALKRWALASG